MSLIDDILRTFPDLAPRKDEIERILAMMERAGPPPDTLNEAFVAELRTKLMHHAPAHSLFFPFMQQKTFVALVTVLALGAVIPAGYALWNMRDAERISGSAYDARTVTMLHERAFGDLSLATSAGALDGKGGGVGLSAGAPMATDAKMASSESFIAEPYPYEPTVYIYTYEGDLASYLSDATGTVYERQSLASLAGSSLSNLADQFSHMNIRPFFAGELTSFVLRANDYMLSVDALGNMWSMYRDWNSYTYPEEWTPMTTENLPSDEAIFATAANFVESWGIDVRAYGSPVIGEAEIALAREGAASVYIPESATVIYPLLVEGSPVYPAWSNAPTGLRISVNLRDLTVTNAYDALTQSYNASTYALTQDAALVQSLVAGGGTGPIFYEGISINEIVVPLNHPERVLMEYSLYENGVSRTLFVPALRFTLEDSTQVPWTSGVVTVPLVKDIAEHYLSQGEGGGAIPLMMK